MSDVFSQKNSAIHQVGQWTVMETRHAGFAYGKFANWQLCEFVFRLKPIVNFMTWLVPALHEKFVGAGTNSQF